MASITEVEQESIDYLSATMHWGYWPFCPVTRGKEVGACYDEEGGKRIVYIGNLFAIIDGDVKLSTLKKIEYANSYDMVKDGWLVD